MHAVRAQPGEMPLADQQPGRQGLLLLRERTSQRIALLPGARAHCISVGRSAAQQRGCVSIPTTAAAPPSSVDELASLHSITSSARASKVGGTSRPSAFAVLRLIVRSILVGNSIGKSPGLAPLRIRST